MPLPAAGRVGVPTKEVCELCGRAPAMAVTLRRHVGMLIFQKFYKFKGPVCRDHGIELANAFLSKTLVQGWWGVTSFFFNILAVLSDLATRARVARMPAPSQVKVAQS